VTALIVALDRALASSPQDRRRIGAAGRALVERPPPPSLVSANLMGVIRAAGIAAVALALLGATSAQALTLEPIGGSFASPVYVTSDPGDAGRLFVVERQGTIRLLENGVTSEFTNLADAVDCGAKCKGERGLMSIAFAPDFDQSGRLYVDYANNLDGTIHVGELTATGPSHDSAEPSTLKSLLEIPHPDSEWHNGGQLQFGPDGNLYISTGDGGGSDDEFHNAQDLASGLGKILRIRPDPEGAAPFYTVPAGNPFAAAADPITKTVWNYGLRNPFRFSFDRLNGNMAIADVGQALNEEIDFAPSPFPKVVGGGGANYGWNCREGFFPGPATDPQCGTLPLAAFTNPVFDYPHTPDPDAHGNDRCSIIGGYVARDASLGALYGRYIYADYCSGALRSLQLPASAGGRASGDCWLGLEASSPVSFGEDAARRLYLVEESGRIYRLAGAPPATCAPPKPEATETQPQPQPTFIGIKPQRRRVERGKSALLTVWVSPCSGRKAESVTLLRNGHANGTKFLSRACTARFLRRIHRGTTFTAVTKEKHGYLPGKSRRVTIRLAHHHRRHQ
jgi:Glucose / Sorbosone dehydrogenase